MFLSLQDFIYLNERLHDTIEDNDHNDPARVIDYKSQRLLQRRNLLEVLSLIYLNSTCWYTLLETESGSQLEPLTNNTNNCKKAYPHCLL